MNESHRIADQLHRAFYGRAWHGPSVIEVLDGVTAQDAARRRLPAAHSIWELVHHISAWIVEADSTARGKVYESLKGERDWPPVIDTSPDAWTSAMAALEQAEASLEETVAGLPPENLGEGENSLYYLLHGIVQHSLYHAGQIALLKRQ